ncbi:MAG: aromatic amino acid lyase [Spirochaetes bacterium]|nr:aromatic amino acid lyase [Spirochaetota bacterium]
MTDTATVTIGSRSLTLEDLLKIAEGSATVSISGEGTFRERIERSRRLLDRALKEGVPVYGVTTGYGKSCSKRMAHEVALKNGENLLRFHGCGTGDPLGVPEVRASMAMRLACFSRGYSGVSMELLSQLAAFLNSGITPVVPSEGSVGASGDLTPMSYVAAALTGEREVYYRGSRMPAREAMAQAGIEPYAFKPKEPIAMINGTATMTGIALMVMERSRRVLEAAVAATALSIHAMSGNAHHYHQAISDAKPHPGQDHVAKMLRAYLHSSTNQWEFAQGTLETLQDPYSLRCSPQILGVLHDALEWIGRWIEIESNSANDNPLIDPESGEVLMGGNFYGGHISFAMDALKSALASVADMSDRQVALMVDPHTNRGLPADLVNTGEKERPYNHGFKAMSIASSALAAEALKLTMPAASFSRSTESHNQDKVSMGTIAARDADRVCTLTMRVLAIHLLAAAQACEIRGRADQRPRINDILRLIRTHAEPLATDRPMDADIERILGLIAGGMMGEHGADGSVR